MRNRFLAWCVALCVVGGFQFGCNRGPSKQELRLTELQGQLTTARDVSARLGQERADLAAAEQSLAEIEALKESKRSDEQKEQLAQLPASIVELGAAKDASFEELQGLLADFLNIALNEFPGSDETKEGLRLYGQESIVIATDMVERAGDYKKAIDNLNAAKNYFDVVNLPVSQSIIDKIAEFDDWRYITEDRFDAVKKNMTKDEVMAVAGVPYYGNIQEDKAKGVETWLYRKREGGVSAVYFKIKTGKVYGFKSDAVKAKVVVD